MKYGNWINRPINILLVLLAIIFIIEAIVMSIMFAINPQLPETLIVLIDAIILTILSAGFIFYLIIKPLSKRFEEDNRDLKKAMIAMQINAEVMKSTGIGILVTDEKTNILSVNPGFTRLTGLLPAEVIGHKPSLLQSGKQSKEFYQRMWTAISQTGSWQGEIYNKRSDGSIYLESLSITEVKNKHGKITNYVGIFQDITQERALKDELMLKARFDALTGIYNRAAFEDHLLRMLALMSREAQQVILLFIDVDKFKQVNDIHGHKTGDLLLQQIAARLKSSLRKTDIIGRFGGDEFVIALSCDSSKDANLIATQLTEKIITAIKAPINLGDEQLHAQISIGISIAPENSIEHNELLRMADKAMYRAKLDDYSSYKFWHDLD